MIADHHELDIVVEHIGGERGFDVASLDDTPQARTFGQSGNADEIVTLQFAERAVARRLRHRLGKPVQGRSVRVVKSQLASRKNA